MVKTPRVGPIPGISRETLNFADLKTRLLVEEASSASLKQRLSEAMRDKENVESKFKAAQSAVSEARAEARRVATDLKQKDRELLKLQRKTERLEEQLKAARTKRPHALAVEDMVGQFRDGVRNFNKKATTDAEAETDESPVFIEKMEVEVKGAVDVAEGVRMETVKAEQLRPDNVSTVRFTLRPAVALRKIEKS